jgi:hypothetical protein
MARTFKHLSADERDYLAVLRGEGLVLMKSPGVSIVIPAVYLANYVEMFRQ